ncbi:MAG: MDR family MFS transporter [Candidatus Limnocylindrales bacterium]
MRAPTVPPPTVPSRERAPLPPLTREQVLVTAGIMAAIAVSALDATVVGTAMPTIIGQLGGLSEYGWVFSAYLLAATTTVPLYAKLADVHGRKPIFLFGLALFVGGSMLCGLATDMPMLIAFRAIQGLGAGALQPVAFTIAGDIFETERRARMQGFFSSVWGVAAVVGPAIGGLMTSTVGWRWVFYLNVPVGLFAGALIVLVLHERFERREHRIDWVGAATLTAGVVLLLFTVAEAGDIFGWGSPVFVALLVASMVLLGLFIRVELRVAEPLIDPNLVRQPLIAAGLAIQTLAGVVMFGLQTYVPPMVQGVHGGSPVEAGAAIAAMSIGWPVGSVVGGRAMLRVGPRPTVLTGGVMLVAGTAVITQLDRFPQLWVAMLGAAITGLGMGLASTTILVVIQGSVEWRQRGVATGLIQFSRTIGGAVGVGLMGGILTAAVGGSASAILDPIRRSSLPASQLAAGRASLSDGLGWIFLVLLAAAIGALLLALRAMPAVRIGRESSTAGGRRAEPGGSVERGPAAATLATGGRGRARAGPPLD